MRAVPPTTHSTRHHRHAHDHNAINNQHVVTITICPNLHHIQKRQHRQQKARRGPLAVIHHSSFIDLVPLLSLCGEAVLSEYKY